MRKRNRWREAKEEEHQKKKRRELCCKIEGEKKEKTIKEGKREGGDAKEWRSVTERMRKEGKRDMTNTVEREV